LSTLKNYPTLPPQIVELLKTTQAPPRLIAHLQLVHHVAMQLTHGVDKLWPTLQYDRQIVLFGAATHDMGKILYPHELTQSGKQHETVGPELLATHSFTNEQARFARTHGQWEITDNFEDSLVALADKIWKGARVEALELKVTQHIARQCQQEMWDIYIKLDDLLTAIAQESDARINWQTRHSL
jgi:hypothetical protein